MIIQRVPLPPADGAPFRCNKMVEKPKPVWWDDCGQPAVEAWQVRGSWLKKLRCAEHREQREGPKVFTFTSTGDAYDATQTNEDIWDGDVVIIESERVVGFLDRAWPVAVTRRRGKLHAKQADLTWERFEDSEYAASVEKAQAIARERGWEVDE